MSRIPPPNRPVPSQQSPQPQDVPPESVVPTLRVMRLQSPELHTPSTGCLDGQPLLHNALCLPDSLEVLVGETFTAYLGVLNVSRSVPIRRLSVAAHLQTPSQRWQLPSPLEDPHHQGVDVPIGSAVDTIVSHAIEEAGQHILRVEVSYASVEGGTKTFRKFYRFQVVNPLQISALTVRAGDGGCYVSLSVEYHPGNNQNNATPIVVADATFVPMDGLVAKRIGKPSPILPPSTSSGKAKATELLDASGFLTPSSVVRYLFHVTEEDDEATPSKKRRGIAAGDKLGHALFTWRKSMGETGRIASSPIACPPATLNQKSVVHRSGWSVDVAAAAAQRSTATSRLLSPRNQQSNNLSVQFPVTVEAIDPPSCMALNEPTPVQLYVVNHTERPLTLQLQFRFAHMSELAVCGPSFVSLGQVPAQGGSAICTVRFLALATGLLQVQGCWVVDLASPDLEIAQPALFQTYVGEKEDATTRIAAPTTTTTAAAVQ